MAGVLSGALLDTSVVVGQSQDIDRLGGIATAAISAITLGELRAGVLLARTDEMRAARLARYRVIAGAFEPIPVDSAVAWHYGSILATARREGRTTKATDLLIVATAAATDRPLATRDQRQAALARAVHVPIVG